MRIKTAIVPTAVLLVGSNVGCHKQDPVEVQELRWLESANPIADARVALSKGDHRLRAVYGLTVSIPGTDRKDFDTLKRIYGISEITGTTDAFQNAEHARLDQLATSYAETYNRQIMSVYKPQAQP